MTEEITKGRSHRSVIATLTFSHMAQHFFSGAAILYQSIREDLGLSYTQVGLMVGVANVLGGLLQICYSIAGRFIPRRLLLAGSNFAMSLGCFLCGISNSFEAIITGKVVAGIGNAGTHPVSSSIISQKFEKSGVGSSLSVFYGLGFVGNILSPVLLSSIAVVAGWRSSFLLLAVTFLAAGLVVFVTLRGEPTADKTLSQGSLRNLLNDIRSSLKVRGAILILVAQMFISGGTGMGVMTVWVPVFLTDPSKGLNVNVFDAGLISSVATIGGVLGTLYLGKVGDRRGYLRTAMASLAATTFTIFLLTFYSSYTVLIVPHLFILSMTTFGMSSLLQAHLAKVSGIAERDILLGLFFTFGFGVSSVWSTLLGAILDTYSFNAIWLTMVGAGIAAITCLFIANRESAVQISQVSS